MEEYTARKVSNTTLENLEQKPKLKLFKEVIQMSSRGKIIKTLEKTITYLPKEQKSKLKSLLSSNTLIVLISMISVLSVSQFFVIGEIFDILVVLCGGAFFGWKAIAIFKDLIGFANVINATSETDLDIAAKHLLKIIEIVEIDSLVAFFDKK